MFYREPPVVVTIPWNDYLRFQGILLLIWILLLPFVLMGRLIRYLFIGAPGAPFHEASMDYVREGWREQTHAYEAAADRLIGWPTQPPSRPANDWQPAASVHYGDVLPPRDVAAPRPSARVVRGRILIANPADRLRISRDLG